MAEENIFLFVPNLIGYTRILLALVSLYFMPLHPRRCGALYALSCLLDALDGWAARFFSQSTSFGAVLDMVTDRCTTTCLLVFLAIAHPAWAPLFQLLICLDFASHYVHMYATLATGAKGRSHKDVQREEEWLLRFYYKKWVLFTACALNELFFIGLYLLCFADAAVRTPLLSTGDGAAAVDVAAQYPSRFSAAAMEAARAHKLNDRVPGLLVRVSAPVMAFKQIVNVVQLVGASRRLAEADRRRRREERRKAE